MSYNPRVHGSNEHPSSRKRPRVFDPRVGIKHSAITGKHGPVGVSPVDIVNKVTTPSGWRIPYFEGESSFEVYYELICARNATGRVKHPTKDRCVRVIAGQLFVSSDGKIEPVLMNQVCSLPHGTEYELASSGDSDVEILVIQEKDYEKDLEQITSVSAVNNKTTISFNEPSPALPRVSADRAEAEATRIREERATRERNKGRRSPVPKRLNETLPAATSTPGGRAPLPGQQIVGVNPRPMGAGGFGDE